VSNLEQWHALMGADIPAMKEHPDELVSYRKRRAVAVITMDDGKVNVLGPAMLQAINDALDRAEGENAGAVVIAGNERVFSGGFDLKVFRSGDVQASIDMLKGGFTLSHRLLSFPSRWWRPAPGLAIAMGSFLACSVDHRISAPAYTFQANEVAIGMVLPYPALEVLRLRLTPSAYQQAVGLAKVFFGETRWRRAGWTRSTCRRWCCPVRWRPPASSRRCRPVRIWPARSGRGSRRWTRSRPVSTTSIPSSGCPSYSGPSKGGLEWRLSCVGRPRRGGGRGCCRTCGPAVADDGGMPPCGLKLIMVCNMLPVFADLDHDVDLTQDPHALDGITSDPVPGAPRPRRCRRADNRLRGLIADSGTPPGNLPPMGRVDGKVALISGAARGMGASHARLLAAEGARVVLGDVLDDEAGRWPRRSVTRPATSTSTSPAPTTGPPRSA
jgi:enoyl-CoA hydratase